jgi:hypothetical protein
VTGKKSGWQPVGISTGAPGKSNLEEGPFVRNISIGIRTGEERLAAEQLGEDAADGPHVDGLGVHLPGQADLSLSRSLSLSLSLTHNLSLSLSLSSLLSPSPSLYLYLYLSLSLCLSLSLSLPLPLFMYIS